eukprot:tig00000658_g2904.t1
MTRKDFKASLVGLARRWAGVAAATPSLQLSIRCIAAGAGLPDDLCTAFLFCLVQTITTSCPPWPAFDSSPDTRQLQGIEATRKPPPGGIRLRPVFDVPRGACTPRGVPRILGEHQLQPTVTPGATRSRSLEFEHPPNSSTSALPSELAAGSPAAGSSSSSHAYGAVGLQRAALENRLHGLLLLPRSRSEGLPPRRPWSRLQPL